MDGLAGLCPGPGPQPQLPCSLPPDLSLACLVWGRRWPCRGPQIEVPREVLCTPFQDCPSLEKLGSWWGHQEVYSFFLPRIWPAQGPAEVSGHSKPLCKGQCSWGAGVGVQRSRARTRTSSVVWTEALGAEVSERLGAGGCGWPGVGVLLSLVGPKDLFWSLAHIQQRPVGGQLYWLHFPPRPHQAPGNWQGCLHPLVGQRGSVCGAGAQPQEAGGSKAGHLGSQGLWNSGGVGMEGHSLGDLWGFFSLKWVLPLWPVNFQRLPKAQGPSAPAEKQNGGCRRNRWGRCSEP